jgi:hypothetical protein
MKLKTQLILISILLLVGILSFRFNNGGDVIPRVWDMNHLVNR